MYGAAKVFETDVVNGKGSRSIHELSRHSSMPIANSKKGGLRTVIFAEPLGKDRFECLFWERDSQHYTVYQGCQQPYHLSGDPNLLNIEKRGFLGPPYGHRLRPTNHR